MVPRELDSLLNYLADRLPPPIYALLVILLSRFLAFLSSLSTVIVPLISTHPSEWTLQHAIPPLMTLLCVYLTLLTLYRTTTWAIRTVIWFFKWGLILGVIFAAFGWYLGSVGHDLGTVPQAAFNTRTREAAGGMNVESEMRPKRSSNAKRPRPWDSFQYHQLWQEAGQQDNLNEINSERMIQATMDIAGRIWDQGGQWWTRAKSIVDEAQFGPEQRKQEFNRKAKTRSR